MATKSASTTESAVIPAHDRFRFGAGERISYSFAIAASLVLPRAAQTPELSRCAAVPVALLLVGGAQLVDGRVPAPPVVEWARLDLLEARFWTVRGVFWMLPAPHGGPRRAPLRGPRARARGADREARPCACGSRAPRAARRRARHREDANRRGADRPRRHLDRPDPLGSLRGAGGRARLLAVGADAAQLGRGRRRGPPGRRARRGAYTGAADSAVLSAFGEHLFARFAALYPVFFVGIDSASAFLAGLETHVHGEVRKLHPDAALPTLQVRTSPAGGMGILYGPPAPRARLAGGG